VKMRVLADPAGRLVGLHPPCPAEIQQLRLRRISTEQYSRDTLRGWDFNHNPEHSFSLSWPLLVSGGDRIGPNVPYGVALRLITSVITTVRARPSAPEDRARTHVCTASSRSASLLRVLDALSAVSPGGAMRSSADDHVHESDAKDPLTKIGYWNQTSAQGSGGTD
jgi:hypothetical protein